MTRVMFICHGNICRSPMAEFVLKAIVKDRGMSDNFEIASSATSREEIGNDVHRGTKEILRRNGIPFSRREARQITKADYLHYDYLICMDYSNIRNLKRIIGEDTDKKVCTLLSFANMNRDIADPWYTGNFDETYRDIVIGCTSFLDYLDTI